MRELIMETFYTLLVGARHSDVYFGENSYNVLNLGPRVSYLRIIENSGYHIYAFTGSEQSHSAMTCVCPGDSRIIRSQPIRSRSKSSNRSSNVEIGWPIRRAQKMGSSNTRSTQKLKTSFGQLIDVAKCIYPQGCLE